MSNIHNRYMEALQGSINSIDLSKLESLLRDSLEGSISILEDTESLVSNLQEKDKHAFIVLRARWRNKLVLCLDDKLAELVYALRQNHINIAMERRSELLMLLKKHEHYKNLLQDRQA